LGDFEESTADLIAIADADRVVGQPFDREVLSELSMREFASLQLILPIAIRLELVHEDRALLASVSSEIALTVAIQI
jgi:hypothetical protein